MSAVAKPRPRRQAQPTYATSAPTPPFLSLPGTLVDATLGDLTDAQSRALAGAQMAWLARQASTDLRLATYSKPLTLDDLEAAVIVLRSFFTWGEQSGTDPTLRGAFLWLKVLAEQAYDAEYRGHPSPLPLRWMARSELDALEAWEDAADVGADSEPPPPPPRPSRARRKPRARESTPMAAGDTTSEAEGSSDEISSIGSTSIHSAPPLATLAPAAASHKGTGKGGRRPRRRRAVALASA